MVELLERMYRDLMTDTFTCLQIIVVLAVLGMFFLAMGILLVLAVINGG